MPKEDEVIEEYSEILEKIYIFKTRGDFTFTGVLYEFLREIDAARARAIGGIVQDFFDK